MRAIIHFRRACFVLLFVGMGTAAIAQVRVLHSLEWPYFGTPVQGRDGRIYAPESEQNYGSCGYIFRISTAGAFTILDYFSCDNGSTPYGGLTLGTDGYFYGTTVFDGSDYDGELYRISGSGGITVLQLHGQALGVKIDAQLLSMLPYLATIVVLVIISRDQMKVKLAAPACLARTFNAAT